MPGLGHLYAGRTARAISVYVGVQLCVIALVLLTFVAPTAALRVGLVCLFVIGTAAFSALDAARVARRAVPAARRMTQRWYVLSGAALLGMFVLQPAIIGVIKRYVAEAYRLPSGSMAPTMMPGDYVFASPRAPATPKRGAIVIYRADDQRYTHRVVGVPGDTLEMRDFKLLLNGVPAVEPYAHVESDAANVEAAEFAWQRAYLAGGSDSAAYRPSYGTWGPLIVPPGEYFLLGDDRANSLDSRYRGFVAKDALVGRPVWIYFSRDPESGAVRWLRIGRAIT